MKHGAAAEAVDMGYGLLKRAPLQPEPRVEVRLAP